MNVELNVAIAQIDIAWENANKNRDKIERLIKHSDNENIDILVLPETFSTGFSMENPGICETMEGATIKWMKQMAKVNDFAICGSILIEEDNNYYNRFLFVEPSGRVSYYDKRHLFSLARENRFFTKGKENKIIRFKRRNEIWKISPFICYDLRFPVWSRNTQDVDIQIYVANFPKARTYAWRQLLIARSIENQCFVVGANRIGRDGAEIPYTGYSGVFDFSGSPLILFESEEGIKKCIINKEKLAIYKRAYPFYKDRDEFTILD